MASIAGREIGLIPTMRRKIDSGQLSNKVVASNSASCMSIGNYVLGRC